MKKLFLDIETIPAGEEHFETLRALHAKNEQKKSEKVSYRKPLTFADFHKGTTFSGAFGRICCIAYALDDGPVKCLSGAEKEMLTKFWKMVDREKIDLFVGHNIMEFDLRFIYQRSMVLSVKPTTELSFARYRNSPIFDTQQEWSKWGKNGESLDTLAHAFGLPSSKDELDGSKVWDYYQAGKIEAICDYCQKDVEVNRQVYKRMVFEGELEPKPAGALPAAAPADETEVPF